MTNVKINIYHELTSHYVMYKITNDKTVLFTGWIREWENLPYHGKLDWFMPQRQTHEQMIEKIQKMYYWLF